MTFVEQIEGLSARYRRRTVPALALLEQVGLALVARGLSGVKMVTSDCHAGLRDAIASTLPGASWQRCRTHYHRNLASRVPKSAWTRP